MRRGDHDLGNRDVVQRWLRFGRHLGDGGEHIEAFDEHAEGGVAAIELVRLRRGSRVGPVADEPLAGGVLKGEFSGMRRLRVGQYRIVYEVSKRELTVLVVRIGHR